MTNPHSTQSPLASASPLNLPSSATTSSHNDTSKDTSMLFIGQPCTEPTCHREDFLPMKCSNCGSCFCSSHFNPSTHRCSYSLHPERKGHGVQGDFLVPICSLCNQVPRGWKREELKREEDVEKVLIRHVERLECVALLENGKKRDVGGTDTPTCGEKKCGKRLVVDIRCEKCKRQFCPSHRAPNQHRCGVVTQPNPAAACPSSKSTTPSGLAAMKRLAISNNSNDNATASQSTATPPSSSSNTSPFNLNITSRIENKKVDRRAQSEQISQLKSLESRKSRGFKLSDKEEQRLVDLKRELGASGVKGKLASKGKDGDCVVC